MFKQITSTFVLLFAFLTLTSIATPTPIQLESGKLETRAGPSGSLNNPFGGQSYDNSNRQGKIHVSYNQVSQNHAQTISIDLHIGVSGTPPTPGDTQLVAGLTAPDNKSPIEATFALGNWCGNLVEHQEYFGNLISFQSAAPSFVVHC